MKPHLILAAHIPKVVESLENVGSTNVSLVAGDIPHTIAADMNAPANELGGFKLSTHALVLSKVRLERIQPHIVAGRERHFGSGPRRRRRCVLLGAFLHRTLSAPTDHTKATLFGTIHSLSLFIFSDNIYPPFLKERNQLVY